jgi:hypothetical protein
MIVRTYGRTTAETVLREAMQALGRVQAHTLARIVVEIRSTDHLSAFTVVVEIMLFIHVYQTVIGTIWYHHSLYCNSTGMAEAR